MIPINTVNTIIENIIQNVLIIFFNITLSTSASSCSFCNLNLSASASSCSFCNLNLSASASASSFCNLNFLNRSSKSVWFSIFDCDEENLDVGQYKKSEARNFT